MVCPYCSHDMEPIELNGKVFCSNCGLTVKTLTEPTRLNPDAKIIGGYKPEKIIQVPTQQSVNPFPSNTPITDPINMNPITDEAREELGFETKANANNDLAPEEVPEIIDQIPISVPVKVEDETEERAGQADDESLSVAEIPLDNSYTIPVDTEIFGNPAGDNEIDNIVKTLSEAELSSHKPIYNPNNFEQIKGIDTLAAGGILLDILSDDLTRDENSAEINALKAARKLVTKITPGNIDQEADVSVTDQKSETDSIKFAAELAKDSIDIKELKSKLENIIEPVTEVYDKDIKKYDPDALNSARVKIEHRSRQGHVPTPKPIEPKINIGAGISKPELPKLEDVSTPLPEETDIKDGEGEEIIKFNTPLPNELMQADTVQADTASKPEPQNTTKKEAKPKTGFLFAGHKKEKTETKGAPESSPNLKATEEEKNEVFIVEEKDDLAATATKDKNVLKDEIIDIEKNIKKGFFASFGRKTKPPKEKIEEAVPETDVPEVISEKIIEKPLVVAMKSAETVAKEASQKLAETEIAETEQPETKEEENIAETTNELIFEGKYQAANPITIPKQGKNSDQEISDTKEDTTVPVIIGSSPIELPTKKEKGFLGLFKRKTTPKPELKPEEAIPEQIEEKPENILSSPKELDSAYVTTADNKADAEIVEKDENNLENETPEETVEITPIIEEQKEKKSFWTKFKKKSKPLADKKPVELTEETVKEADTVVQNDLEDDTEAPETETEVTLNTKVNESPEDNLQTEVVSKDKTITKNHVTADYFKKVLEVKKAQQKLATKMDKKTAKNKRLTVKKVLKITLLVIICGLAVLVASFLVYNNNRPEVKLERTLSRVEFTTKKPSYIPEGYEFKDANYNIDTKIFELTYEFITDKTRKIILTETIKPEPQKYIDGLIKTDFKDQEYTIKDVDGQEFTEIKKYNLIWYRAEMVYTLQATNANIDNQLLYKMTRSIE